VRAADWLLPLVDAVIVAVPADRAVIVNVALDAPAGTVTGVSTFATAGFVLDNESTAPPVEAAVESVTVAWIVAPTVTFDEVSEMLDTPGPVA
jgi:hypothetical protein